MIQNTHVFATVVKVRSRTSDLRYEVEFASLNGVGPPVVGAVRGFPSPVPVEAQEQTAECLIERVDFKVTAA